MKILAISPVDLKNAAHNRLHDFVDQLSRRNAVDVISTYAWWLEEDAGTGYKDGYYENSLDQIFSRIENRYLSEKKESPIKQEIMAFPRGRKILGRSSDLDYDVIFNYNTILSGLSLSAHMTDVPMVYDLADDIARMAADSKMATMPLKPFVESFSRRAISIALEKSRRVTVATKELISTYRASEDKVDVVPNGVNTDLFYPRDKLSSKKKFGLEDCYVVGYVGVLREWVDFDTILGSIAMLKEDYPKLRMLIVGGEGRLDELMRRSEEKGVRDRLIFTGTLPYSEIPGAISAMDIGIIPFSMNEVTRNALPLKLFEYMACGIPVITQKLKPIIDAVGDGVIYASNAKELATGVNRILSGEIDETLIENGKKTIASGWDWKSIGLKLESTLKMAISG